MANRSLFNPSLIKSLITKKSGQVYVSDKIISTIQSCITTSYTDISIQANKLKAIYDDQKNHLNISVNYDDQAVIDAYTIKYLPRNTLIPKLGILYSSYHPLFSLNTERLRILDLGSGTGAIPLGIIDFFQNPSLSHIKCDIFAFDASMRALVKQIQLINSYGLSGSTHTVHQADFTDITSYKQAIERNSPYDIIFSANLLSELEPEYRDNIMQIIQDNLHEDGLCIIAESQNCPAKAACARLSHQSQQFGLNVYFPCPPQIECMKSHCWKWFNFDFESKDILVENHLIDVTKIHKVIWRILTKQSHSIYDYLTSNYNLIWGITRHRPGVGNEFCSLNGQYNKVAKPTLNYIGDQDPWSQLVGISNDTISVKWDLLQDFSSCNHTIS